MATQAVAIEYIELRLKPDAFLREVQRLTNTPLAVDVVVGGGAVGDAQKQIAQIETVVAKAKTDVQMTVDTKPVTQAVQQATTALADYISELEFLDKQVRGEFSAGLKANGEDLATVAKALQDTGITAEQLAAELGVLTRAQEAERQAAVRAANEAAEAERARQEAFLKSPEYLAEVAAREAKEQAKREAAAEAGRLAVQRNIEAEAALRADLAAKAEAQERAREATRQAERDRELAAEQALQEDIARVRAQADADQDARLARRAAERQAAGTTDLIGNAGLNLTSSADAAFAKQAAEAEALVRVVQKLDVVLGELGTTFADEIGLAGIKTADELRAALEATGYSAKELDAILGDDAAALRQVGQALADTDGKGLSRLRQGLGRTENVFGNMVGNFVQGAVRIQGALQPVGLFIGQLGDLVGEKLFQGLGKAGSAASDLFAKVTAGRAAQTAADQAAAEAARLVAVAEASQAAASELAAGGASYATIATQAKAAVDGEAAAAAVAAAGAYEAEAAAAAEATAASLAAIAPYAAVAAGLAAVVVGLKLVYEWTRPEQVDDLTTEEIKLGDALLSNTRALEENADALSKSNSAYKNLSAGAQAYAEATRQATEDQTQFNALLAAEAADQGVSRLINLKDAIDDVDTGTGSALQQYQRFIEALSDTDRAVLEGALGQKLDATKATAQIGALQDALKDLPADVEGATSVLADAGGVLGRIADQVGYASSQYDKLRDTFNVSGTEAEKEAVKLTEAAIASGRLADDSDDAAKYLINMAVALSQAAKNTALLADVTTGLASAQQKWEQALAAKGLGPKAKEYEQLQKIIANLAKQQLDGIDITDQQLARIAGAYGSTVEQLRSEVLPAIDAEVAARQAAADAEAKIEDEQEARRHAAMKAATDRYLERAAQTTEERTALLQQITDQQTLAAEVASVASKFGIVDDRISQLDPAQLDTIKGKVDELSGAIDTWAQGLTDLSFGGVEDAIDKLFEGGKVPTVQQVIDANAKAVASGQKFSDLLQTYYSSGQDETAQLLQTLGEKYGTDVATKFADKIAKGGPDAQAALAAGLQLTDQTIAAEQAQWQQIGVTMGETIAPEIYNAIALALEGEPYKPLIEIEEEAQKAADEVERKFIDLKVKPKVTPDTSGIQADLDSKSYTVKPRVVLPGGVVKYSFAGGDLKAGETSIVNELGLESFLRRGAQNPELLGVGRFGTYKAPTDGIVLNHLQTAEYLAAKAAGMKPSVAVDASGTPQLQVAAPAGRAAPAGPSINANFTIVASQPGQARQEVNAALNDLLRRVR